MIATKNNILTEFLNRDDASAKNTNASLPTGFEESEIRNLPLESTIFAVIAIVVACALGVVLGWQIALLVMAGLAVKTILQCIDGRQNA